MDKQEKVKDMRECTVVYVDFLGITIQVAFSRPGPAHRFAEKYPAKNVRILRELVPAKERGLPDAHKTI